jgi:tetratricopeptide (TPR) repeat protein
MRKILLFFIILASLKSRGQTQNIDSLKEKLSAAKEDTNKVQTLLNLSWLYQWNKLDSAILYGMKARILSRQLKYIDGEIQAAYLLSTALSTEGNYSQAMEIDFNALHLAEKTGKPFEKAIIGFVYNNSGDYTKALEYFSKYLGETNIISNEAKKEFFGETFYHLGRLDSAFFYINQAYQIDKNNNERWSSVYYYMALIDAKEKKFKDALDNYRL